MDRCDFIKKNYFFIKLHKLKVSTVKIFEPFYCADESKNKEKSGFGLGLSIAKNLAENNGYRLRLDDTYGDGCRFILVQYKI